MIFVDPGSIIAMLDRRHMRKVVAVWFSVAVISALCQPTTSRYQVASITAVSAHPGDEGTDINGAGRYDISVRVGGTVYVVLYTALPGTYGVKQIAGHNLLVLVGADTIRFNDLLGRPSEAPILSRETLPPENDFEAAVAPDRYYTSKYENLSRKLNLTPVQQGKLRPILEQETGELAEMRANPVLSLEDKMRKFEKVVGESDEKLKQILSAEQQPILLNMRSEQKRELRKWVAAKKGR
jgi:hypothetical protein